MSQRKPRGQVSENLYCFPGLSPCLSGGVVLWLRISSDQRPLLVRIYKLSASTKYDASRTGVYKDLDSRILRRLQQVLGALYIDLVVYRRRQVEMGRCCVDDGIRFNLSKKLLHSHKIGNVAIVVGDRAARVTV